ncbi:HAD hydrolase-like protein [Chitinibacter sp. SCUT-21]|uniref:HAD family hydrolase n=1 Tax=Chitinibacter sp. SCUT-21 TaxID=2970891 RepID=UPI0035A5F7B5
MNIANYKTLIFDCDGVVLDSNKVKTEAFYKAALPFGEKAAQKLVSHHVLNGGISRYKKFEWFIQEVVSDEEAELNQLLESYAQFVKSGLFTCDIAEGLSELREKTCNANWLIVSGGDQQELREVFAARKLIDFFDGGVFGSPDSKDLILEREIANNNIQMPAIFLGDSRYDHVASSNAGLDFLFLNYWTEFENWKDYCQTNNLNVHNSLRL